jgi:hypothetical protein
MPRFVEFGGAASEANEMLHSTTSSAWSHRRYMKYRKEVGVAVSEGNEMPHRAMLTKFSVHARRKGRTQNRIN